MTSAAEIAELPLDASDLRAARQENEDAAVVLIERAADRGGDAGLEAFLRRAVEIAQLDRKAAAGAGDAAAHRSARATRSPSSVADMTSSRSSSRR